MGSAMCVPGDHRLLLRAEGSVYGGGGHGDHLGTIHDDRTADLLGGPSMDMVTSDWRCSVHRGPDEGATHGLTVGWGAIMELGDPFEGL